MFHFKDSDPGKKTLIIKDWTNKGTVITALTICKSWFRPQQAQHLRNNIIVGLVLCMGVVCF